MRGARFWGRYYLVLIALISRNAAWATVCGDEVARVEQTYTRQQGWTLSEVLDAVIALHEAGFCVWAPFLREDSSDDGAEFLFNAIERRVPVRTLYATGIRLKGTWSEVLISASAKARRLGKPDVARALTPTAVRRRGMQLRFPTAIATQPESGNRISPERTPLEKWIHEKGGTPNWLRKEKPWKAPPSWSPRGQYDWSEERIRAVFSILEWEEVSLDKATIGSDNPLLLEAIHFVIGKHRPGSHLVNAVVARWGSNWTHNLEILGYPPSYGYHSHWTKKRITRAILALYLANRPLSALKVSLDRTVRGRRVIKREIGIDTTAAAVYQAAKKYFGNWDAALLSAGLDPEAIRLRSAKAYWDAEKVTTAIYWLAHHGVALNPNAISLDASERTKRILAQAIGWPSTGKSLYLQAFKLFGGWWDALEAAGFDPDEYFYYRKYSEKNLIDAVNTLHRAKVPLNAYAIQNDFSPETKALIKKAIGWTASGKAIYDAAFRMYGRGGWDALLIRAGKDPRAIRKRHYARSGLSLVTLQTVLDSDAPATRSWQSTPSGERNAMDADAEEFCAELIRIIEELPDEERELNYSLLDTLVDNRTADDVSALVTVLSMEREEAYSPIQVESALKFLTAHEKLIRFRWRSTPNRSGRRSFDYRN
ncbi:MAG: hypothetical protein KDD51_02560 [Bdellovibrionales bacterium]|nr:hypothetical protein [Bdellovibrionales bacterium]